MQATAKPKQKKNKVQNVDPSGISQEEIKKVKKAGVKLKGSTLISKAMEQMRNDFPDKTKWGIQRLVEYVLKQNHVDYSSPNTVKELLKTHGIRTTNDSMTQTNQDRGTTTKRREIKDDLEERLKALNEVSKKSVEEKKNVAKRSFSVLDNKELRKKII